MATNNGRSWAPLVPLVTAVLYGASPIDLIPDILLLVGWIDDGMMAVVMAAMALWLFVRSRRTQRVDGPVPPYLPIEVRAR
jgi:uncharacterized membrane protein YkvA (DUF1232 family)